MQCRISHEFDKGAVEYRIDRGHTVKEQHADACDALLGNPEVATAFLNSQKGAILHEVGHYVAANLDGLVRGHIIIPVDNDRSFGAFVPDDPSAELLSSNLVRWSLVSSAGIMAEHHFCNHAKIGSAKADIAAYQSRFGPMPADLIVARWKRDHLDRIAAHTACIKNDFDRCARYCRSNRFRIGDHHVIPSCVIRSPRWRSPSERLDEVVWTYPIEARRRALDELLAAQTGVVVGHVA
jgi:hypothetical protein